MEKNAARADVRECPPRRPAIEGLWRGQRTCGAPNRAASPISPTVCTVRIDPVACAICVMHPMFPVAITSGCTDSMLRALRSRSCFGHFRLKHAVCAGRAAADVAFRNIEHAEPRFAQQARRKRIELLPVLERARGVIRHPQIRRARWLSVEAMARHHLSQHFRNISRPRGDPRRLGGVLRVCAEQ